MAKPGAFLVCGWCGRRLSPLVVEVKLGEQVVRMALSSRQLHVDPGPGRSPVQRAVWSPPATVDNTPGEGSPRRRSSAERSGMTRLEADGPTDPGMPVMYARTDVSCHPKRCGRTHLVRSDHLLNAFLRVRQAGGTNVVVGDGPHARAHGGHHL